MSLVNDPMLDKLFESSTRVRVASARVDELYRERGLALDATVVPVSGEDDELLLAMKELQAANAKQGEILSKLVR
jgi:hypothetical protein